MRFHITNLSELSKQIRDLGMPQFGALYMLEKKANECHLCDSFIVSLTKCSIIMTLASIKYNNGIKEYYYNWEMIDVIRQGNAYS